MRAYVRSALALLLGGFVSATASAAPVTIALRTFEQSRPSGSGNTISGILPEEGLGEASGFSANASTQWQSPTGNGSVFGFRGNNWASGDYFAFQVSTLGMTDIALSFDQTRNSDTSPANFSIRYSIDGGSTFSILTSYAVPIGPWSSTTVSTASQFGPFALPAEVNNQPSLIIRLRASSAGTGTNNHTVDNVHITGIPEPSALGLLGVGAALLLRQRRKPTLAAG
jgi:hypothetical protein